MQRARLIYSRHVYQKWTAQPHDSRGISSTKICSRAFYAPLLLLSNFFYYASFVLEKTFFTSHRQIFCCPEFSGPAFKGTQCWGFIFMILL
jgi:hypothetical protein